jgi:putative membrane protein
MKNKIQMLGKLKTLAPFFGAVLFMTSTFIVTSCKDEKKVDTEEVADDKNEEKFDGAKEDDSEHLVEAAALNLTEIRLGELAQSKAVSKEVKDFGKMMVEDHNKTLGELKSLAGTKQITLPAALTEEGEEAHKKFADESATDFDKKYVDKMVDAHQTAIEKFEKMATDAKDSDIKAFATKTLPALRTHLDHALTLQKKLETTNK